MIEIDDEQLGCIRWYPHEVYHGILADGQSVKIVQAHLHTSLIILLAAMGSGSLCGEGLADIEETMNGLIERQTERVRKRKRG